MADETPGREYQMVSKMFCYSIGMIFIKENRIFK